MPVAGSIAHILSTIAEEADIDTSVYQKYIRHFRVHKEDVGENVNAEDDVETTNSRGAEESHYHKETIIRMGTSLQIHEDYFLWSEQTRITQNKNLQAHGHSKERQAQRHLEIERTACQRSRDALEREQSRLLGREAQLGNQLWAHVRQEGECRRTFDHCVTKSATYKKILAESSDMVLISSPVRVRVSSSDSWHRGIVSLKEGFLVWDSPETSPPLHGEVRIPTLQRLTAFPPNKAVGSSGILFGSCRAEPTNTRGKCFGREVVLLEWEGGRLELAPMFSEELNELNERRTSGDGSASMRSTSVSSATSSILNDDGVPIWTCHVCSHSNTDILSTKCAACMSPADPPAPPPPPSRPIESQRRSNRTDPDELSEPFEMLVSSLDFILATRFEQQLPLLGSLVDRGQSVMGQGARKRAFASREAVTLHLSVDCRTSSEASSLQSPASSLKSWSSQKSQEEHGQVCVSPKKGNSQPKTISELVSENLQTIAAKLGITDNAHHQLLCAHRERADAQASILRAVSRREKTLELLGTLKQLQDMCRRPPLQGNNGRWTALPEKKVVVLSEIGRRLSQALETTNIPDLWFSASSNSPTPSQSAAMTSWPPLQDAHSHTSVLDAPSQLNGPITNLDDAPSTPNRGVKGTGLLSSVEVLRLKKRSAAEKRRSSHNRFLRSGVDDFAVEPNKLRVCNIIYEYQTVDPSTSSPSTPMRASREPPELAKEFDRMRELIQALWDKEKKFMVSAHALAREKALLLRYIQIGHVLTDIDTEPVGSCSLASNSALEESNLDLVCSPSLDMSNYYTPTASLCGTNPSLCEDPHSSRSLPASTSIPYQSPIPTDLSETLGVDHCFDPESSSLEPTTLTYYGSSSFNNEHREFNEVGRDEQTTEIKEEELFDIEL